MMMREQHRLAKRKDPSKKESWGYKLLMAIPRNLVYVFVGVILFAFLGMLYVLYFDTNLTTLLEYQPTREKVVVHPLFQHFKSVVDEYHRIPVNSIENITSQDFYTDHLTKNVPLVLIDGCEAWPAYKKWSDKEYLQKEFAG